MKNSNKILYSVSGNIAKLTINRPERRNALDAESLEQINILMDEAESDEKVRVILITGQGDTFSSGFDLKEQMEKAQLSIEKLKDADREIVYKNGDHQ